MDTMQELDELLATLKIDTESQDETIKKIENDSKEAGMLIYNDKQDVERAQKIFYGLTEEDRDQAVKEFIVPPPYKYAQFDEDKIRSNLKKQHIKNGKLYKIYKLSNYLELCNGILSAIRMRQLPKRSYLIGAPNGFGKSSFVNECLITLRKQGFKVVPYISLLELAHIRVSDEQRIMNPYKRFIEDKSSTKYEYTEPNINLGFQKKPEIIIGRYSYSEYINADCLFVGFTDVISKEIESHTLYQLLNIRGAKGLPTIAMMSTSLEPYENDKSLRDLVWNEIKAYDEDADCYDRVYHVSCYKLKNLSLDNKGEEVDVNTGIVLGE